MNDAAIRQHDESKAEVARLQDALARKKTDWKNYIDGLPRKHCQGVFHFRNTSNTEWKILKEIQALKNLVSLKLKESGLLGRAKRESKW
jgi:hypothetical protein